MTPAVVPAAADRAMPDQQVMGDKGEGYLSQRDSGNPVSWAGPLFGDLVFLAH
jgi:hypothetical protein